MGLISPAQASCTSYAPADGTTVICSGSGITSVLAGQDVTINFLNGTEHTTTGSTARVRENSEINLYGNAEVISGTIGLRILSSGSGNTNATIALNDTSSATGIGSNATVLIQGSYSTVILNDQSSVKNTGTGDGIQLSLNTVSGHNTVIVGENALIEVTGSAANAVDFYVGSYNVLYNYGTLRSIGTTVDGSSSSDIVYNYGTIVSSAGLTIGLGSGNDRLTLGTGSEITGNIDGGDGTDDLTLVGSGSEDGVISNFESLTMAGTEWELTGTNSFGNIVVESGILRLNGVVTGDVEVSTVGTLGGTGTIYGDVTSFGTLSAGNSVGTATIVGNLVQNGGSFVEFDAGGVDRWNVTGTATLVNNPTLTITSLDGTTTAYGVILHADGGITGSFALPVFYDGNGAASIEQTENDIILTVIDGTSLVADHYASLQTGMSFFDQLSFNHSWQPWQPGSRGPFWLKAFGQSGDEEAQDGNEAYEYAFGGTAAGWETKAAKGMSLGASLGLSSTEVEIPGTASASSSRSLMGALYTSVQRSAAFLSATIGGGASILDLSHTAAVGAEKFSVETDTNAWLMGGALQAGVELNSTGGWSIIPSASLAYLHQWVEGYREEIGSASAKIDAHDTGLLRLRGDFELRHVAHQEGIIYVPHLKLGVVDDIGSGGVATGSFSGGTDFQLSLSGADGLRMLAGLGLEALFENGSTARIAYEGEASPTSVAHALALEVKLYW